MIPKNKASKAKTREGRGVGMGVVGGMGRGGGGWSSPHWFGQVTPLRGAPISPMHFWRFSPSIYSEISS